MILEGAVEWAGCPTLSGMAQVPAAFCDEGEQSVLVVMVLVDAH